MSPLVKIIILLFGISTLANIVIGALYYTPGSYTAQPETPNYTRIAESYSEYYIQRLLKSPSTAKFCHGTATDLGNNRWKVVSCVDSQNSYGAMIRSNWQTIIAFNGNGAENLDSWKIEQIIFDGKMVYQKK